MPRRQLSAQLCQQMFSSLGLFKSLACPDSHKCTRKSCLFSHQVDISPPISLVIPVDEPRTSIVPSKRPVSLSPHRTGVPTPINQVDEPPRKLQKLGLQQKPLAIPTVTHTNVRDLTYFHQHNATLTSLQRLVCLF